MRRRLDLRLKFLSRRIQRNAVCADRNIEIPSYVIACDNFYVRGIDRRRTMFYFVAEKWHSVTPPAVNLIDAFGWSLTRCVGETH